MYPADRWYTEQHEWIKVEKDVATLGITHFAQEELGDIVYVELPEAGQSFAAGDELGSVESVKAVADVYTPVTGDIVACNEVFDDSPELLNVDPHGDGWMVKVRLTKPHEVDGLMSAEQYQAFLQKK